MKTIILNGSPRKNWNTAMMLKEAKRGAESVGAETEYIDLFDLRMPVLPCLQEEGCGTLQMLLEG